MSTESQIFRFKFSDEFIGQLTPFAKLFQHSDRNTYKEEWNRWVENNDEIILNETYRLTELGYNGNITDKMYKSGRYYFRNKKEQEPRKRRQYVSIDHELIENMDTHINSNLDTKPSVSYGIFCESYSSQLDEGLSKDTIKDKFKKTFKNRYFLITKA
tara:strand:+ start:77 stop:550 length:474 start_codon:yes stop_codon:yes gene_type:complete